jgi:hypothetical protein
MNRRNLICAVMLVLSLVATHHVQSQENSPKPTTESKNSENALEILSQSTRFIDAASAFMIKGKSGGELLLDTGQLVEYGTTFTAIFKRPSQLRLQLNSRRGHKTTMIFDGEMITVASIFEGQQIYDTATQLSDVNDSLDFMTAQIGSHRELEYFLSPEWTQSPYKLASV